MKICPCGKENYTQEDFCEKCNQSIQHINHETFRFQDFFIKILPIYAACIGFIVGLNFLNFSIVIFQAVHLIGVSAVVIVLGALFFTAYQYDNPRRQNKRFSGDLIFFYIVNVGMILGIIGYVSLPDQKGITLLPSLLFYLATFGSIIIFMKNIPVNKQKIMSWVFVLFILSSEIFLIGYYSILVFAKYNLSPDLWYYLEISSFSFSFLFFGLLVGGIVAFCFSPPFKPFNFFDYFFHSVPEDYPLELIYFIIIFLAFTSPSIWQLIHDISL